MGETMCTLNVHLGSANLTVKEQWRGRNPDGEVA